MKRLISLVLGATVLATLGGCVYPNYRPGVVYDDGTASYDTDYAYPAYSPSYAYYPGYYDPWYYGAPWVGVGFYGSYYGGHHWHGHDGWHGGHGNWHGGSGSHGSHSGGGSHHGH